MLDNNNFFQDLKNQLKNFIIFKHMKIFNIVDSSNDEALALEKAHAESGTIVMALKHRSARGQRGRFWLSKDVDLCFSILLRHEHLPKKISILPHIIAVGIKRALKKHGLMVNIKWPNDIVIKNKNLSQNYSYCGEYLKLGGILIENVLTENKISASIIGMAMNFQPEEDLREVIPHAASLSTFLPKLNRESLSFSIISELDSIFLDIDNKIYNILKEYRESCVTLGRSLSLDDAKPGENWLACEIDDDGVLLVENNNIIKKIYGSLR